jgi:sugar-specific transcriptional regulator TrmB
MDKRDLYELGLTEGEAEIYLALLQLGSANVMELAKQTGRHRTHIYDTIEKLKEKSFISESKTDSKKSFHASDPKNILSYLKEKEEKAHKIIQGLEKLKFSSEGEITVETLKGVAGIKMILRDILQEKKDYVGYGEGVKFQKLLPEFYNEFRGKSEKLGIGLRLIVKNKINIEKRKNLEVRHLNYVSPSTTFIYGNKIAIIIWEPFPTVIHINNKQVTISYKNYFEILWKNASKQ